MNTHMGLPEFLITLNGLQQKLVLTLNKNDYSSLLFFKFFAFILCTRKNLKSKKVKEGTIIEINFLISYLVYIGNKINVVQSTINFNVQ